MTIEQLNALPADYQLHWYRIERVLGQGGFGITYLANDTNLEQLVAVKEYLPVEFAARATNSAVQARTEEHQSRYEWGLERFISEARTLARFDHSNIVRVYSVFEHNNTAYMVMRYEQGENLHNVLAKRKVLEEEALMGIALPILDGLEEIHRAGFIHRDIKPDNIYIRDDKTPVLLDFGSARQAFGDARTLTILVAPGYAPFEQYYSNSDQQGPWTDIYSLGATLYRAVTGAAPADAISRSKGILGSTRDILVPAAQAAQGRYSQTLLKAIDHALEFAERDRPQSIAEWRVELLEPRSSIGHSPARANAASSGAQSDRPNAAVAPVATPTEPFDIGKADLLHAAPTVPAPAHRDGAPSDPAHQKRWMRVGLLGVIVVAALATGLLMRPYLQDKWSGSDPAVTDVEKIRQAQKRLEDSLQELQGKLSTTDSEKQLEEQQKQRREEERQRAEAERQRLAEEQRRAEAEKRALEEEKRRAEAESQKIEEGKRRADAEKRKAEEALRLARLQAEKDAQREALRRRDAEIAALLAAAETNLAGNRLSTPPGNNAVEPYRAILELDPKNPEAHEGLENVVARYVDFADRAANSRNFDRARGYLDRAEAVLPGNLTVSAARKRIAEEEKRVQRAAVTKEPPEPSPGPISGQATPESRLDAAVADYEKGDYAQAFRELEPLADEHGLAPANYYLGLMYARGDGIARSDAEAVARYRAAAERGYAPAQKSLGVMYTTGRGVARDDSEALNWYRRAAEQGNVDAQINLGNMYADGIGVAQSAFEAYAWFALAEAAGNPIAKSRRDAVEKKLQPIELEHARKLAHQYESKFGAKNASESKPMTKVLPKASGSQPAMNADLESAIAIFEKGEYASALREFESLAGKSNPQAAYYLGKMYAAGKGVKPSDSEAVLWYRQGADEGYSPAQNSLGVMHATGRGVDRDDSEAIKWYRRAAEQGNADAQINLANMYADGRGVAQSDFEAYAWYDLAAESGNQIAIDRRDATAKNLQPLELEHAQKLARKYKEKYMASQ